MLAPALVIAALAAVAAGCGSTPADELPPPAEPASAMAAPGPCRLYGRLDRLAGTERAPVLGGRAEIVVEPRAREIVLRDRASGDELAREPAGVGPTRVVADGERRAWVVDTAGDGLLVVRVGDRDLEVERRVHLPGRPYDVVHDEARMRLWVNLTEPREVAELPAHGRPHVLARHPVPDAP